MKKILLYSCYIIAAASLLASSSCKRDNDVSLEKYEGRAPESVRLSGFTSSSITVDWDQVENAVAYTVQILASKDDDTPVDAYTTVSKDFYKFSGLQETRGYYIRVRACFNSVENPAVGDWTYLMNGQEPARIMPKYGFVDEDFEEPEPQPTLEPQLYPDFPEGFEVHEGTRKSSYTAAGPTGKQSDVFPSGEWLMNQAYTTNSGTALIHKVGDFATMMAPNLTAFLSMDFDLPYGASKFSFICGAATRTNANETGGMPITLTVEYSQDGGNTWTKLGDDILLDDIETQYAPEFDNLNITGPVRFRINKNSSKARPIIDEVAVYYTE